MWRWPFRAFPDAPGGSSSTRDVPSDWIEAWSSNSGTKRDGSGRCVHLGTRLTVCVFASLRVNDTSGRLEIWGSGRPLLRDVVSDRVLMTLLDRGGGSLRRRGARIEVR